jgi:hypothetical protein
MRQRATSFDIPEQNNLHGIFDFVDLRVLEEVKSWPPKDREFPSQG